MSHPNQSMPRRLSCKNQRLIWHRPHEDIEAKDFLASSREFSWHIANVANCATSLRPMPRPHEAIFRKDHTKATILMRRDHRKLRATTRELLLEMRGGASDGRMRIPRQRTVSMSASG